MSNYIAYSAIEMPAILGWVIVGVIIIVVICAYKGGVGVGERRAQTRLDDEREEYYNRIADLRDTVPMEALNERTIRNLYPGMLPRGEWSRHSR